MRSRRSSCPFVLALCAGAAMALASVSQTDGVAQAPPTAAAAAFVRAHPESPLYLTAGRITTVSGAPFAHGASAQASANDFINRYASIFGVHADDLVAGSLAGDAQAVHALMKDENGGPKFTLLSYVQHCNGVPVFRADLRLLVRNLPGAPLVLARSALKDIGAFHVDDAVAGNPNIAAAFEQATAVVPGLDAMDDVKVVVFAGDADHAQAPTLAVSFIASRGKAGDDVYEKHLFVADASTGRILYDEDKIEHIDVSGTVTGIATPGKTADTCIAEVSMAMPYARAAIGATEAYADKNGNFTITNAGSGAVTVAAGPRGKYFRVFNPSADAPTTSVSVTPPGPANIVLNAANSIEQRRAEVNAYLNANVVRDYALTYDNAFPIIAGQTSFRVNTAVSGTCNAFYDGSSINFYNSGGGCANTAFGDVVWHEYGHHMVDSAGSGQDQYGEGYGDLNGIMISDEPVLGYGFQTCATGIRDARNSVMYPCGDEIHTCGQLLTGCFWDTREKMVLDGVSGYNALLSSFAVNSVQVHTGGTITPQITIDVMTLDDDDANISNGTPHYSQIQYGFSKHNMAGPNISYLSFTYPTGRPALISPSGGPAFTVQVGALAGTPQPNTGVLHVDAENDGTYVSIPMAQISTNLYQASFPATLCTSVVRYYVSAKTTSNVTVNDPNDAPVSYFTTISAASTSVAFTDSFETNKGWTTASTATSGAWARAIPNGGGGRGDPANDYDTTGSGYCYVTQNGAGDTDVDGGTVTLTSPTMSALGADEAILSYARWYSNNVGSNANQDTFVVEVSNNNGTSWVNLETVGPANEANGGWYSKSFKLSTKFALTSQIKVRFKASDDANGSVVEAGVDSVSLALVTCPSCPPDFNGDGFLNGDDFDAFLAAFEAGDIAADYDGDGFVTGNDFDAYAADFEAGC